MKCTSGSKFVESLKTDKSPLITRWWWIRHAPVMNGNGRLYGQEDLDCDVSDTGKLEWLASYLPSGAIWLVTNLSRTQKTAKAIRDAGISVPELHIISEFAEQYFGDWQGLRWDEMEKLDPIAYREFWEDPSGNAPPNGESFKDLIDRVSPIIKEQTEMHAGNNIVCVAHGGSIRAALSLALGLHHERGLSISIDTLSLTRIDHVEGGVLDGIGKEWSIGGVNLAMK